MSTSSTPGTTKTSRSISLRRMVAATSVALLAFTATSASIAPALAATNASGVTVTGLNVAPLTGVKLAPPPPLSITRYGGEDRYKTSALIAATYPEDNTVFVANGLAFADALSAAPAAAFEGAALLLVQQNSIPAEVRAQIIRLNPSRITVIGGTGVISETVFNQLAALTDVAYRIGGIDRYETSKKVFESVWRSSVVDRVFLADGRNFPDALSAASAAGSTGSPVVLVNGASPSVPSWFATYLPVFNTKYLDLVGGEAVLSAGIETTAKALPGITAYRHFGADRYATSWKVNNNFFEYVDTVYLAVGTGFADALAGAALAGKNAEPLYLVPGNCVPRKVLEDIDRVEAEDVVLFGGIGVLSPAVEALTPCP